MKPTYTTELTEQDLIILCETLDYLMHHFEAENPEDAQTFDMVCRDLHARLSLVLRRAGIPNCTHTTSDVDPTDQIEWWTRAARTDILH